MKSKKSDVNYRSSSMKQTQKKCKHQFLCLSALVEFLNVQSLWQTQQRSHDSMCIVCFCLPGRILFQVCSNEFYFGILQFQSCLQNTHVILDFNTASRGESQQLLFPLLIFLLKSQSLMLRQGSKFCQSNSCGGFTMLGG